MPIHKDFPESPHTILDPSVRWFPDTAASDDTTVDKLMPPLVSKLRREVHKWRESGYVGATNTSKSLLQWWFHTPHLIEQYGGGSIEFQYYFAQQEAIETIIWLVDVMGYKDQHDLLRFDSSGAVSSGMFDEHWRRLVIKMATGSGKTKVMSLALAWSFFHKTYEPDSTLSRNFLVIAPNIIVLDRIYHDFQGLRIFFHDPVVPDNGFDGQDWRNDFQLTLHRQDEVRVTQPTGNIFLTNIHRVYSGDETPPSPDDENTMDYFFGPRPTGKTTDSTVDLGTIVRDIDELMVLNDEAHHVHDPRSAWFQSIADIHNRLLQKDRQLALQIDVTATPKHNNGAIFVQTVCDYPLVEAISQNVVKHPVLPDKDSRDKLAERQSAKYTEKYADYLNLGVIEWRKAYEEHAKVGKKAILFVMTDATRNCDDVAAYLEANFPDLKDSVLVIHTKQNGEISEAASAKKQEELTKLRKQSNEIDDASSPYKAIVSVMMLKEGWDVKNVTTIVGLRPYSSNSNILPEQTLGRGLRKMYPGGVEEYVSVIGTDAFMDFVESIQEEGVVLERGAMGAGSTARTPLIVEVDFANENKDIETLDIEIPLLTPRTFREYKNLNDLDLQSLPFKKVEYQQFSDEEQREIVFNAMVTGTITHTTVLDPATISDYRNAIGYFAQVLMNELRLVSGYDVLYGKLKDFIRDHLFEESVELDDANTLRNLSDLPATKTTIETFKTAINAMTVRDSGGAEVSSSIRLRETRPFVVKNQGYVVSKKSVFNRTIGDSDLELRFAAFLEDCSDVDAYAKNYFAVKFRLDYVRADGNIANYYPDFFVRMSESRIVIVETKGKEDSDVEPKMNRLRQWCDDVNSLQSKLIFDFVYVDETSFDKYSPKNFAALIKSFVAFKKTENEA